MHPEAGGLGVRITPTDHIRSVGPKTAQASLAIELPCNLAKNKKQGSWAPGMSRREALGGVRRSAKGGPSLPCAAGTGAAGCGDGETACPRASSPQAEDHALVLAAVQGQC